MDPDKEQQLQVQDKTQQHVQVSVSAIPHFTWPSSKPGPQAKQAPPGQRSMPTRTEQMEEIGYNQETGTPSSDSPARSLPDASRKESVAFDQQETPQDALKKRKKK